MNERVSVIIPVFNGASTVRRAIESALKQTHRNIEVVVIDDGSTDETAAILQTYGTAIRVMRQANSGVSNARNLGIAESHGAWIAFLDADDERLPEKTERQLRLFSSVPSLGFATTGTLCFGARGVGRRTGAGSLIFENLLSRNSIVTSSVMVRKSCLAQFSEAFRPDLKYGEDWELWLRLAARFSGMSLPDALVKKYSTSANATLGISIACCRSQYQQVLYYLERDPATAEVIARHSEFVKASIGFRMAGFLYEHGQRKEAARELSTALAMCPTLLVSHSVQILKILVMPISVRDAINKMVSGIGLGHT